MPAQLDALEVYRLYRSRIEQQSALLTQRAVIAIPLQGGLFVFWSAANTRGYLNTQPIRVGIVVTAELQLVTTLFACLVCWVSISTLANHLRNFDDRCKGEVELVDKAGKSVRMKDIVGKEWPSSVLPPVISPSPVHWPGHIAPLVVLIALVGIWLQVAFAGFGISTSGVFGGPGLLVITFLTCIAAMASGYALYLRSVKKSFVLHAPSVSPSEPVVQAVVILNVPEAPIKVPQKRKAPPKPKVVKTKDSQGSRPKSTS